ncbi:MAG: cytidylate kinase-like family protein [Patescibacteria group bacterium]
MALNYNHLVDRTLKYFSVKTSLSLSDSEPEQAFLKPFITVAREPGSGGAPIAEAVAKKLGYEFVDEQLVEAVARSTRKRKAVIQEIDEKSRTKIEDIVHSILNVEYVDEQDYVTALVQTILSYAHRGNCVILGRGSNFITPFAKGLHVSIVAPYEVRVQRAMDYEGHSEKKAKRVIAEVEKERADFVKQYFSRNLKQRNVFDLTLNTTYFTVPQSRQVIIEAFRQKFA